MLPFLTFALLVLVAFRIDTAYQRIDTAFGTKASTGKEGSCKVCMLPCRVPAELRRLRARRLREQPLSQPHAVLLWRANMLSLFAYTDLLMHSPDFASFLILRQSGGLLCLMGAHAVFAGSPPSYGGYGPGGYGSSPSPQPEPFNRFHGECSTKSFRASVTQCLAMCSFPGEECILSL